MRRHLSKIGRRTWITLGFLAWVVALVSVRTAVATAAQPADKSPALRSLPQAAASAQAGGTYVGDKNCLGCHEEVRASYERSPHHLADDPRTPAAKQGCETCHGPGSKHMDDPDHVKVVNNFTAMSPAAVNATCTTCHNRGEHALWEGSQHERRDLSCTSCHSMHKPLSEKGSLKAKTETEVCAPCHRDKASKLDRSGHMPLREGKMACSSCHNMHGATNVKLLRKGDSIAELCTSCHADKRGPYLWEHAPTRDGCVTCHDPHGSSNERMLVVKPPMLCQRCHVASRHPSTIYDQALINTSVRVYARSCVTCHANIHGSNHPSGQFFIR
jgi:DmsE family decaheme c-type cytochrome